MFLTQYGGSSPFRLSSSDAVSDAGRHTTDVTPPSSRRPDNERKRTVLGLIAADPSTAKPGHTPDVTIVRELTQAEYQQVHDDAVTIQHFDRNNLLPYLELNHRAVCDTLDRYKRRLGGSFGFDAHRDVAPMQTELTCTLLNWLSSMRMLLDHSEHAISRLHGRKSEAFKSFGDAQSWEYDNAFAYRFLYKLRNHVQHQDLKIHTSGARARLDEVAGSFVTTVRFDFDRDTLLESNNWGIVVNDLRQQHEAFAVMPVLDEGLASLRRVSDEGNRLIHPNIVQAAERMEIVRQLLARTGEEAFLGQVEDDNGRMTNLKLSPLDMTQTVRVCYKLGLNTPESATTDKR